MKPNPTTALSASITPRLSADVEKEFRFLFSAPLVDLTAKEEVILSEINDLLKSQLDFLALTLASQRAAIAVEVEEKLIGEDEKILEGLRWTMAQREKISDRNHTRAKQRRVLTIIKSND